MKHNISQIEVVKSVRKTWGDFNPVTRKINSKKLYIRKNKFGKWD